ncbi:MULTISPECIES: histidine phosphatase family protein [unclassified Bradyrhizobium]|uniref:histidine phosphatase family protein n=1 Tax=unclassified Bradyrhizobium TaxID=2631580 RepID=UPI0020B2C8BD|nr:MULTISPECIES: histidine phosphatase family protein [unclassified Bradyrhizobium]MCP3402115.1 histidine phosphatase family protein [Bradyrhizobium sp. CCGB20]MCP3410604.1 histidine phosphatase family protein [Bradyrhizobium sp. CCGB01]
MASVVHLVRHGHHALLGRTLCGRMDGVTLSKTGSEEIARCARNISPRPSLIQSSPRRRCVQSASILSAHFRLPIEIVPALDELNYGEWTDRSFADLHNDRQWSHWNTCRGSARPPGGESMRSLQRRVVNHLEQLRNDPLAGIVIAVSHAEPIRAALLHYACMRLDDFLSIEIDPASISTLSAEDRGFSVTTINQRVPA